MAETCKRESASDGAGSLYDFRESFCAALVLTGSVEGAERALKEAIAASGSEISPHGLLTYTVRFILREPTAKEPAALPPELQALSLLPPLPRCCFVLRFGVDLDVRTCSEMLGISSGEVEVELCHAVAELPKAVRRVHEPAS